MGIFTCRSILHRCSVLLLLIARAYRPCPVLVGGPFGQLSTGIAVSRTGDVVVSKEAWELIKHACHGEEVRDTLGVAPLK